MSIITDIVTPPATEAYRDGWDRVFGKRKLTPDEQRALEPNDMHEGAPGSDNGVRHEATARMRDGRGIGKRVDCGVKLKVSG